jgi:hypothetical protein
MMAKRLNFTKRAKIPRERVEVSVFGGQKPRFEVSMDLSDFEFPGDARIFIEAGKKTEVQRFPWGTVAAPRPPIEPRLTQFSDPTVVKFRIKIVASQSAQILGVVRDVRPSTEESAALRESILAVESVPDMDEVWRLVIDETEPILQVNTAVSDKEDLIHSLAFKTLVLPAVLRQILSGIVQDLDVRELSDYADDEWQSEWIRFGQNLEPFDHPEHPEQWVDDCVATFCKTNRIVESFEQRK